MYTTLVPSKAKFEDEQKHDSVRHDIETQSVASHENHSPLLDGGDPTFDLRSRTPQECVLWLRLDEIR